MNPLLLYLIPAAFILAGILLAYLSVVLGRPPKNLPTIRAAEAAFAHELPYFTFAESNGLGVLVHVDLTYSAMAELSGIDADCLDDETLNQLSVKVHGLLQNLPSGVCLQLLHETDDQLDDRIEAYRGSAERKLATPGPWLIDAKANQLRLDPTLRRSRLFLCVTTSQAKRFGVPGRAPSLHKSVFSANHRAQIQALSTLFEQVKGGLVAAGVQVRPLDAAAYRRELYRRLNPTRHAAIADPFAPFPPEKAARTFSELQSVREQVVFSGIHERARDLFLDGQRLRVLTLKSLPTETHPGLLEPLLVALPFHVRTSFAVETLDSLTALDHLKQKRDQAHVLATFKERRNQEAEAQEEDVLQLIEQNLQSSVRMTRVCLSVVLSVDDERPDAEQVLDRQEADVLRVVGGMRGAQLMLDELCQLPEFLATLPGNAARGRRWRTCTSENAAHLLPMWQPFSGSRYPLVLLQNGRSNLVGLDPFDPSLDNPNAFMAGSSGSGKSATTTFFLINALASGAKALIVDVGGSYRRVIETFSGQYFQIGLEDGAPSRLNFFFDPKDVGRQDGTLDGTRHQLMCAVVERMVCDPFRPQLRNAERMVVSRGILETYRRKSGETPILSDLVETFSQDAGESEDARTAHELARQLRVWTEGPAARLLNGPSTIELTADCAAFDLKGLEGQTDLQSIVMLILSGILWNLVMRDRTERKMIVFDEVWKLLSSPSSAAILEELYRTSRKYRAAILTISQSVDDFSGASIASALMNNSATTYLLRHRRNHAEIGAQFRLNPHEREIFTQLEMRPGKYTEALILHGEHHFLGRIHLSPLEYWIATTHPSDIALEEAVARRVPDRSKFARLCYLAERYPSGADKTGARTAEANLSIETPIAEAGGLS